MSATIQALFDRIWQSYVSITPEALPIHNLFATENRDQIINDHIALRTFNCSPVSLQKIAAPFVELGYKATGEYQFPNRKLFARHFQHHDPKLPKVFISELLVEELSARAQQIIFGLIHQVDETTVAKKHFCCSGRPWSIDVASYNTLLAESEYAAWVAAHGYQANHFTLSLNYLELNQELSNVNKKIIDAGFKMNDIGGLIKGSPDELLEQSSTMAKNINVPFSDGEKCIPGGFYEFAKRYPMTNGTLYQGFVAASADKIFDSTKTNQ